MPLQAKIADKLAIVRNMRALATDTHMPEELLSGFPFGPEGGPFSLKPGTRPTFGSVVSKLRPANGTNLPAVRRRWTWRTMPHGYRRPLDLEPAFLGLAHQPFDPSRRAGWPTSGCADGVTLDRLEDRKKLLAAFDTLRRDLETTKGTFDGHGRVHRAGAGHGHLARASATPSTSSKEPEKVRQKYGTLTRFLQARRLVEAGRVGGERARPRLLGHARATTSRRCGSSCPCSTRASTPWSPTCTTAGWTRTWRSWSGASTGGRRRSTSNAGRDHWPQAMFALVAGGGFKMGQVIGATTARAERPVGAGVHPAESAGDAVQEVFGIDPATTLPDHTGRPVYLLDERETIKELSR